MAARRLPIDLARRDRRALAASRPDQKAGGRDHSIHTAPGTTDLDLVLVTEDGSPYDIDRMTDEEWPEVWVDIKVE